MNTRRCPRCQTLYQPPARFCVRDGSPLVDVGQAARPATTPAKPTRHRTTTQPAIGPGDIAPEVEGLTLENRFRIGPRVGEGGMAVVYRAEDLGGGAGADSFVAVKILAPRLARDQTALARLRREAKLATRLRHPNVCPIVAYGENDDLRYLVMPFLDGESLNEWELRVGPAHLEEGVLLLRQICQGLHYAHGKHVLHRDLKPENIMLVPDDGVAGNVRAVVTDFGLAKALDADSSTRRLTGTGIILGTPEFMSPEQIRGKPLDARSDVFALGVLAFELLSGTLPFSGETAHDILTARLDGRPRALGTFRRDLPHALEQVIAKALTRDPAGRYPTMDAFAKALAPFVPANGYRIRPTITGTS